MSGYRVARRHHFRHWFEDFFRLFFPDHCLGCDAIMPKHLETLCMRCRLNLPYTQHHFTPNHNPVMQKFWGKANLKYGMAYLKFYKGGKVQKLMHALKYQKQPQIGVLLGESYGYDLTAFELEKAFDVIIPLPMHPRKLKIRGYNQAACFGIGLAKAFEKPMYDDVLLKATQTDSQTRKSRINRWLNVKETFVLNPEKMHLIRGKHVLLVDDVITTGSTLEAAIHILDKAQPASISVAAIASAT
jgi:ComF family protein